MAFLKKKNCARTTLASGITAGATSLTVSDVTKLPTTTDFMITIWNKAIFGDPCDDPNSEILKVTNIAGSILTVMRAQESTSAVAHSSGHAVEILITAGQLEELETAIDGKQVTGSYLENIVEDLSPQLGAELDAQANTIGFTLTNNATSTIDWRMSNKQVKTLTSSGALTFTNPSKPCNLLFKIIQGGSGSYTITWPATVKWPSGTAPTLSTSVSSVDIISLFFDGTNYYGVASLNFS